MSGGSSPICGARGTSREKYGGATPADASSKMANTISASNRLRKTYNPVNIVSVRRFDEARKAGRKQLREEQNPPESVTTSAGKVSRRGSKKS